MLRNLVVGVRINGGLLILLEVEGWLEGLGGENVFACRRSCLIIWDLVWYLFLELLV